MKKRILSVLMALAMCLGLLPAQALAADGETGAFTDADSVSSWAKEAMTWAVGVELVNGMGGNQLVPAGSAERAQIATILYRFCEKTAG